MKRKRKLGFFSRNYSACWKFLKESEWYVVFVIGVFFLAFLVGFIFPIFFKDKIFALLLEMALKFEGKGVLETVVLIFLNNMWASLIAIVLGVLLGIVPLINCVVNGYLVGFVSRMVSDEVGIFSLWRLLPHGIFELPALFFSLAIGLRLGIEAGVSGFGVRGSGFGKLKKNFKEGMRFFVFVIFPLLLVAGIIEGILVGVLG